MIWEKRQTEVRQESTSLQEAQKETERVSNFLMSALLLIFGIYFMGLWLYYRTEDWFFSNSYSILFWSMFLSDSILFADNACVKNCRPKAQKYILTFWAFLNVVIMNLFHGDAIVAYVCVIFFSTTYRDSRFTILLSAVSCVATVICCYISELRYWNTGIADLIYYIIDGKATIEYDGGRILNLADYMTAQEYALRVTLTRCPFNVTALLICTGGSVFFAKNNYRILKQQHEMDERRAEADRRLAETEAELNRNRVELLESNSRLLVSQIQPHFMFNILNSIYHLCDMDRELAQSAVADFSDYLRTNLDALKSDEAVPFSVEKKHIETYLRLEKMRFGKRLNVEWDVETENFDVPVLSVQPLVENAVKHGICSRAAGGTIRISTKEEETAFRITVADDGIGFDDSAEWDNTHVGLKNVRNRLAIMSHGDLHVHSKPNVGTVVEIVIHKNEEASDYSGTPSQNEEENHADTGAG